MIIAIAGDSNQSIGSGKDTVGRIIQYLFWKKRVETENLSFHYELKNFLIGDFHADKLAGWEVKKFADVTTKSFELITGINFHKLSREEKEKIRAEYVKFAEGCKKIFGEDVWVNSLMKDYKHSAPFYEYGNNKNDLRHLGKNYENSAFPNWIITDLRFPNEYKAVKDRKGLCIKVVINKPISKEELANLAFLAARSSGKQTTESVIDRLRPISNLIHAAVHSSETALNNHEFDHIIENNGTIDDLVVKVEEFLIKFNLL